MVLPDKGLHRLYRAEFFAWVSMRWRCFKKTYKRWDDYGGRGITVCRRWDSSFRDFLTDVGEKPSPEMSIDRIDNDGHYSCGKCEHCAENGWAANCRWATSRQQMTNTRRNVRVTFRGETKTVSEWAEVLDISEHAIRTRLRRGWSPEQALGVTTWGRYDNAMEFTLNGRTQSVRKWAVELGFRDVGIVYDRIKRGWSVERALLTPARRYGKK